MALRLSQNAMIMKQNGTSKLVKEKGRTFLPVPSGTMARSAPCATASWELSSVAPPADKIDVMSLRFGFTFVLKVPCTRTCSSHCSCQPNLLIALFASAMQLTTSFFLMAFARFLEANPNCFEKARGGKHDC